MRHVAASLFFAVSALIPQGIPLPFRMVAAPSGDVVTAADFTLVGYKDIRVLTENSMGIYSDGYESGLAYRRVSGDLRFLILSANLAEFSVNSITFDNGSTDVVATNHWVVASTGFHSQDDGCAFIMLSATRILATCTESYADQPVARLYTMDLDPTGNTVSNVHGPVGIHGIGSKRVGTCVFPAPAAITAAYPGVLYIVGCGAYHSRTAQNRSSALGPVFIGIPDPTAYDELTGVTTTVASASSAFSVVFTSTSGFSVGDAVRFDSGTCGGQAYILSMVGTAVALGNATADAGGFDCTVSAGVTVTQLGEIPESDYKIFANTDGTSFNTFCDSWYPAHTSPPDGCDRGLKLAGGLNYQDFGGGGTTPGINNPTSIAGTANTSSSGNTLVITSAARSVDQWWAGYSGVVGGNTVNSSPPYTVTLTGVGTFNIATWSDETHLTVATDPGNHTGIAFTVNYDGPHIPPTDQGGWLAYDDAYSRAAADGFSRWWQADTYFANCIAIDGSARSGTFCLGAMSSVINYYCGGQFCIGGNTAEAHIFDNAHLLEAAAGTRAKWNVRPTMTDWTSYLTYGGPIQGGSGRTYQPSAVIRDTTTGYIYVYRPAGGGTYYPRIYKLSVNTSAPVPQPNPLTAMLKAMPSRLPITAAPVRHAAPARPPVAPASLRFAAAGTGPRRRSR